MQIFFRTLTGHTVTIDITEENQNLPISSIIPIILEKTEQEYNPGNYYDIMTKKGKVADNEQSILGFYNQEKDDRYSYIRGVRYFVTVEAELQNNAWQAISLEYLTYLPVELIEIIIGYSAEKPFRHMRQVAGKYPITASLYSITNFLAVTTLFSININYIQRLSLKA